MTQEKTIGILIARMTSSRLPGKALRMVGNKPLLAYSLERLKAVEGIDEVWLATTQHPSDEALLLWAIEQGIQPFAYAGEIDDVVGRISAVVEKAEAHRFIMVLGDTPFPDIRLMNRFLKTMDEHPEWESVGVKSLNGQPSVHCGIGCFTRSGWYKIDQASQEAKYREHSGSILNENPDLITMGSFQDEPVYYEGSYRLSVDTQADLMFVRTLVEALQKSDDIISFESILQYLKENPEVCALNQHVRQKTVDEKSTKILMAVQAGEHYGTGHLARCQSLARMLEEYFSVGVTFWLDTEEPDFHANFKAQGYTVVDDNVSLMETLRQQSFHRLVIDFRDPISHSFMQAVRLAQPNLPIIVLDNNGVGCATADAVIFPNAHAKPNSEWSLENTKVYQGASYALLGPGLLYDDDSVEPIGPLDLPTIFITMGGSDPELISEHILEMFKDVENCHIDLVVPPLYAHPENLEKIATRMPSTVTLHWKVRNLRPLMDRATVAVSAFGVTAYELAYRGIPTILLGHSQAKEDDMKRFSLWGSAISVGWWKNVEKEALLSLVFDLIQNLEKRKEMSNKGKALVDGIGPQRVAEVIMATTRQPIPLKQE